MKKIFRKLLIFATIVSVLNLLIVLQAWLKLPARIPCAFSPSGTSHAMQSRDMLFLCPLISMIAVLMAAFICRGRVKKHIAFAVQILALAVSLILLSSTGVALTHGTHPFFMWAEPAILLLAIIAIVVQWCHDKKKSQSIAK